MAATTRTASSRNTLIALAIFMGGQMAMAESEPAQMWSIVEINGVATIGETFLGIDPDGNAFGSSGCNRFHSSVQQSGFVLSFGAISTTRMVCPPSEAEQEKALFRLLAQQLSVSYHVPRDQVALTAQDGSSLVLQRSE